MDFALSGGEDYELLFTAASGVIERVKASVSCPVSIIGEVVPDGRNEVSLIGANGKAVRVARTGWEHFAAR